jgi:hypothetical protein
MVVALTVTAILIVLMLQMFMRGAELWRSNDERLDTFREARAGLQMIAREFSGMSPVISAPTDFPILALHPHGDTADKDRVNHELYGILPARSRGRSDLCAVGYFCAWDESKRAFVLRRQITESDTTFANLRSTLSTAAPATGMEAFNRLYARESLVEGATSVEDVASFIWDFKVSVPDAQDPAQTRVWPQGVFSSELPQWVEISFKAMGHQSARKLADQPVIRDTWFDESSLLYQRFILPREQRFITRVKLCR